MTYCPSCEAEVTETDYEAGFCTQCGYQIATKETSAMSKKKQIDYNVRRYPELDRIAQQVANETLKDITERAAKTPDYGMRYVQQYILEEVVQKLQARI